MITFKIEFLKKIINKGGSMECSAKGNFSLLVRLIKNEEKVIPFQKKQLEDLKRIIFFLEAIINPKNDECSFGEKLEIHLKCLLPAKDYIGLEYDDGLKIFIRENDKDLFFLNQKNDSLTISRKGSLEINLSTINKTFLFVQDLLKEKPEFDEKNGFLFIPSKIELISSMEMKIIHNDNFFHLVF